MASASAFGLLILKDNRRPFLYIPFPSLFFPSERASEEKIWVKQREKGKLTGLVEKTKQLPSKYALTGIHFLKPTIFKMIKQLKPSWRGELEITEAIQLLIENGYNVGYQFVKGWWKDTGAPEDILEANRLVLDELKPQIKGKIEDKNSIQGRVSTGENTIVKQHCY